MSSSSFTSLPGGYRAVIIGATGGIGSAFTRLIENDPNCGALHPLSRQSNSGIDLRNEDSIAAAAAYIKNQSGEIHLLIIASGILTGAGQDNPEKAFSHLDHESMRDVFDVNTHGPALALKYFLPLMARSQRTLIGALSARVGSIGDNGLGGWMSYRASKAALNQIVRCAAIEVKRKNDQAVCLALHPGTIETDLTRKFAGGRYTHSADSCAANLANVMDTAPAEKTGSFFDYAGEEIVW